jgi:hypothetical protein
MEQLNARLRERSAEVKNLIVIASISSVAFLLFSCTNGARLEVEKGKQVQYKRIYSFSYGLQAGQQSDLFLVIKEQPQGSSQLPLGHAEVPLEGNVVVFDALSITFLEVHEKYLVIQVKKRS